MISVSLPFKKRVCPLLLGEEFERKVQLYLRAIQESGGAVNMVIVMGGARGIIILILKPCTTPVENGIYDNLTKAWAKGLLGRMGSVKKRGNRKQEQKSCQEL